jgi:hypothetical protein
VELVAEWEKEKKATADELDRAKADKSYAGAERLGEAQTLASLLDDCPPEELPELRSRVRGALRLLVQTVVVLVVPNGTARLAAVQCFFNPNGRRHRELFILTCGDHWWARSFADVLTPGDLDLRRRGHADLVEKTLAALDVGQLHKPAGH